MITTITLWNATKKKLGLPYETTETQEINTDDGIFLPPYHAYDICSRAAPWIGKIYTHVTVDIVKGLEKASLPVLRSRTVKTTRVAPVEKVRSYGKDGSLEGVRLKVLYSMENI